MHIKDFQQLIEDKYGKRDRERGTEATFMWFIEEVGELSTALAEKDTSKEELESEFADVIAWLCTLANIKNIDLEQACKKYTSGQVEGYK